MNFKQYFVVIFSIMVGISSSTTLQGHETSQLSFYAHRAATQNEIWPLCVPLSSIAKLSQELSEISSYATFQRLKCMALNQSSRLMNHPQLKILLQHQLTALDLITKQIEELQDVKRYIYVRPDGVVAKVTRKITLESAQKLNALVKNGAYINQLANKIGALLQN